MTSIYIPASISNRDYIWEPQKRFRMMYMYCIYNLYRPELSEYETI